ncbi:MAG: hypothetical protein IPM54_10440 [Polyangiaceae bacterium]|nr:hypothetical protein [Polyangiaceae bacterium]
MPFSKSLRDQVDRYLAKMQDMPRTIDPQDTRRGLRYMTPSGAIFLDEAQRAELFQLVENIRTKYAKHEWSFAKIKDVVQEAILVARENADREMDKEQRRRAIAHIETVLDKPFIEWEVYFSIIGINEDCLPIDVGRTSFHPPPDSLSAKLVFADDAPCDLPESVRASCRQGAREEIDDEFGNSPWACVKVMAFEGDDSAAATAGLEEIRLTLDVVNFYADLWRPINYRARAALKCEPDPTILAYIARPVGKEVFSPATDNVGPIDDVWLYPADAEAAKEYAFDRVAEILKKDDTNRTEIDHRLLAALRWAGRATIARRRDEAFLLFMMALEALVMGTKHADAITYRLQLRIGQLASPEVRKKLSTEIRELYDKRSRLVHSGIAEISELDLWRARNITKDTVIKLLQREPFVSMTKNKEMDDWFDDRIAGHAATDASD